MCIPQNFKGFIRGYSVKNNYPSTLSQGYLLPLPRDNCHYQSCVFLGMFYAYIRMCMHIIS